jgi:hypothetical protein
MAETGAAGARPSPADNGIAAKTPREAVAAARQALATAKSVHVHGYLESGEPGPDKIDMWYGRDGLRGTMTGRENGTSGRWVVPFDLSAPPDAVDLDKIMR